MVCFFVSWNNCFLSANARRLETINALPPDLIYKSASRTALELAPRLRQQGAELIVALTDRKSVV